MRILGLDENYYHVHYGHGLGYDILGPFYRQSESEDAALLKMTEKIKKPMKSLTWVTIQSSGELFRMWRRVEDEVWKEFPVG